jgi:hypothetical protein
VLLQGDCFSKVKRGKRSGRDAELVRGKRRRLGGASIKLHPSARARGGGDDGAWCGGASVRWVAAARASEGRKQHRRWAKLGPKQKRAGRLDGPPW